MFCDLIHKQLAEASIFSIIDQYKEYLIRGLECEDQDVHRLVITLMRRAESGADVDYLVSSGLFDKLFLTGDKANALFAHLYSRASSDTPLRAKAKTSP